MPYTMTFGQKLATGRELNNLRTADTGFLEHSSHLNTELTREG